MSRDECACGRTGDHIRIKMTGCGPFEQPTASAGDADRIRRVLWSSMEDGAKVDALATLLADVRREERERVLGEVEDRIHALKYDAAIPSPVSYRIAQHEAESVVREARGGAG